MRKKEREREREREKERERERERKKERTIALPSQSPRVNSTTMHCRFLKQRKTKNIIYI